MFYRHLFSVSSWTLVSRLTGFVRDIILGHVLGAGILADAFYIAFRLPNHFRAIFAEGAFNAAFIPSYAHVLETKGEQEASHFSGRIFSLLLVSQIIFLLLAWIFTPQCLDLLAPGVDQNPEKYAAALLMTRITFPYLLCMSLVTLISGRLNAHARFSAATFAPVLLNLFMIGALALAFLFPDAGIAASVGVTLSGFAQLICVWWAARRANLHEELLWPRLTPDVRAFFRTLGPAVMGSASTQIAMFADTILASLMATGAISALYYADRLYQIPIGLIGIAAGTVLLPHMSRLLAHGDREGALATQNKALGLTLALSMPFCIGFALFPDVIIRGVFLHGKFTPEDVITSSQVLSAYALGLIPIVLLASTRASFQARRDTRTPMMVAMISIAANVALKWELSASQGAAGLAYGTSLGSWINFGLLLWLAIRQDLFVASPGLKKTILASMLGAICMALSAWLGQPMLKHIIEGEGVLHNAFFLCSLATISALAYGAGFGIAYALMIGSEKRNIYETSSPHPPPC